MKIQTKQAEEFGRTVILYRATTDDGKWGTLWHSSQEKATRHYQRRYPDPFPLIEETRDPRELPTVSEWLRAGAPMREVEHG